MRLCIRFDAVVVFIAVRLYFLFFKITHYIILLSFTPITDVGTQLHPMSTESHGRHTYDFDTDGQW